MLTVSHHYNAPDAAVRRHVDGADVHSQDTPLFSLQHVNGAFHLRREPKQKLKDILVRYCKPTKIHILLVGKLGKMRFGERSRSPNVGHVGLHQLQQTRRLLGYHSDNLLNGMEGVSTMGGE